MTVVVVSALETILGGTGPVKTGSVRVDYWAGTSQYTAVDGDEVTFPSPITVQIVDGALAEPLDLTPTGDVCCARIIVRSRGRQIIRYVTIPASGPVDFADLIDVDPATFAPDPSPTLGQTIDTRIEQYLATRPLLPSDGLTL